MPLSRRPLSIALAIPLLAIPLLSTADLAAQTLVADLGKGPIYGNPASDPRAMTSALGSVLMQADQPGTGTELWLTDGTRAGTRLIADVEQGYRSSYPQDFVALPSGDVLFTAETTPFGRELWVLKPGGAQLVADIRPGPASSLPYGFATVGAEVFFFADDGASGRELWKTDGTPAGTAQVIDLVPGAAGPWLGGIGALGNRVLFFTVDNTTLMWELWSSDGTSAGTFRVVQRPAEASRAPGPMATLGNKLLFRAWDPVAGEEPWVTDGTAAGTFRLADIAAGTTRSTPSYYFSRLTKIVGGKVLFIASTPTGDELWTSDGTVAGTTMVVAAAALVNGITATLIGDLAGGDIVFSIPSLTFPFIHNLYRTDGTAAGTTRIADLGSTFERDAYPGVLAGGVLYFPGNGPEGTELWRTDGTAAGTTLVADIAPGPTNSGPSGLSVAGTGVVFSADDGNGRELWHSDGTTAGTTVIDLAAPPVNAGSFPRLMGTLAGRSYWATYGGALPWAFWESDGTRAGTGPVLGTQPLNNASGGMYVELDERFVFAGFQHTTGDELWASDGTGAGTGLVIDLYPGSRGCNPRDLVKFGGRVFFAADDEVHGRELWSSDGTAAGTILVADISPGSDGSSPSELFAWKDQLFFLANAPLVGRELHVTDGTPAGTRLVADIRPGWSAGVYPPQPPASTPTFAGLGDYVYFAADDGALGRELWRSDGTPGGTTMVRNIYLNWLASSNPFGFAAVGGRVVFAATDHNGMAVWATDGTSAGTRHLRAITGRVTSALQPLNQDEAMFWVDDNSNASQLWKSHGATGQTSLIKTINASNVEWTTPFFAKPGETRLLFNANDGITGDEPWVTDGTTAGTTLLANIAPIHSNPHAFVRVGHRVMFVANDGVVGAELHAVDLVATGDYAAETYGSGCPGSSGDVPEVSVSGEVRAGAAVPFAVELTDAVPQAATALFVGLGRARLPLPGGCSVWTAPLVAVPATTNAAGSAAIAIQPIPAIAGLVVHFQYVTLDPGGALLGVFSSTSGLEVVGGL